MVLVQAKRLCVLQQIPHVAVAAIKQLADFPLSKPLAFIVHSPAHLLHSFLPYAGMGLGGLPLICRA